MQTSLRTLVTSCLATLSDWNLAPGAGRQVAFQSLFPVMTLSGYHICELIHVPHTPWLLIHRNLEAKNIIDSCLDVSTTSSAEGDVTQKVSRNHLEQGNHFRLT